MPWPGMINSRGHFKNMFTCTKWLRDVIDGSGYDIKHWRLSQSKLGFFSLLLNKRATKLNLFLAYVVCENIQHILMKNSQTHGSLFLNILQYEGLPSLSTSENYTPLSQAKHQNWKIISNIINFLKPEFGACCTLAINFNTRRHFGLWQNQ